MFACFWRYSPRWARASSFTTFLDHNDAPQSVGLPWTSDQFVAETSTWQHTTLTTVKRPCPRWNSNLQSQQASGRRPTPWTARPLPYTLLNHWLLFVKTAFKLQSRVKCSQTKINAETWISVSSGAFSCVESVLLLNPVDWGSQSPHYTSNVLWIFHQLFFFWMIWQMFTTSSLGSVIDVGGKIAPKHKFEPYL
jgi:hypothetical protein